MLTEVGYEPIETVAFVDHHRYRDEDITRLIAMARSLGANGFVTTEKDAVKITEAMRKRMALIGPLIVARLIVEFENETEVLAQLISLVGELDRRKR